LSVAGHYSGHVYTDDTTLPLQNDDPTRRKTFEAKLWVYAKDHRHGPPLIVWLASIISSARKF